MSKKYLALAGIALAIVFTAFLAMPRGSEGTAWSPFFGPTDFYRLSTTAVSANPSPNAGQYPDIHAQYNVFAPSSNFTPLFGGAMTLGGGQDPTNDVLNASAAGVPNTGALIGSLSAGSILGLANAGCNSLVPVTFRFVEASVDQTLARPLGVAPPATSLETVSATFAAGADNFVYAGADYLGTKTGALTTGTPGDANHPDAAVNEIKIDSENMLVTGVNPVTNVMTVLRGWDGTMPAQHNAGAPIDRVNIIFENGPPANLLANLAEDDGDIDNNNVVDHPDLANNIADGADEVPVFVKESQDPDGLSQNGGSVPSYARYVGNAPVQGLIVILQFSILAPGVLNANNFPNLQWVTTDWGYQSVTYLQNPIAPPSNSAITDFCNFSSNTFFYGLPHDNECTDTVEPPACNVPLGGFIMEDAVEPTGSVCQDASPTTPNECATACAPNCTAVCPSGDNGACWRARNPTSSSIVKYYQWGVSQRDYDNDGHENGLDVCSYNPNPGWNPRFNTGPTSGGDTDADGLPTACDPNDNAPSNDQDLDGWLNRLDNCPVNANTSGAAKGGGTVPNTYQFDLDVPNGVNVPDAGPRSDGIGGGSANPGDTGCDIPANSCDVACGFPAGTNQLTRTGANGHYHATAAAQTICIGAVADANLCSPLLDEDNDGVVNARDNCVRGSNAPGPFNSASTPKGSDTLSAAAAIGDNSISVNNNLGFVVGQPIIIDTGANRELLKYITDVNPPDDEFNPAGQAAVITFADYAGPPALDQKLQKPHAIGATVAQVAFAQGLRDFNNDGFADGTDITILAGSFGKLGGDPARPAGYQGRFDLNNTGNGPDSQNDGTDITLEAGTFGKKCGPTPSGT